MGELLQFQSYGNLNQALDVGRQPGEEELAQPSNKGGAQMWRVCRRATPIHPTTTVPTEHREHHRRRRPYAY
ncbi:hypothetical protein EYF80_010554 [Liparis tanakae]|uniref:Uncharacterized protein n=1 Tax=Liparis tanakae TaxID=230148 RepID=A0A4Z2IMS8_9TELE|nr:hypothetical protein EYF80_010554 [Liparis tanakae]